MTTVSVVPNAAGDNAECTPSPAVANYLNVDDGPSLAQADGDSSVNYSDWSANYRLDLFNIPNQSLSGTISSIVLHLVASDWGGSNTSRAKIAIKTHGTVYYSSALNPPEYTYSEMTETWTTNPYTGEAWTWEEINDLQIGYAGIWYLAATALWVVISYNAVAAGSIIKSSRSRLMNALVVR